MSTCGSRGRRAFFHSAFGIIIDIPKGQTKRKKRAIKSERYLLDVDIMRLADALVLLQP